MNTLTDFKLQGEALGLEFLEWRGGLAKGTLKGIFNAWVEASVIDLRGAVWVRSSGLHTILRTTAAKARYLVAGAAKRDKVQLSGRSWIGMTKVIETFLRSSKVCEWVSESIQSSGTARREDYLRYSEAVFRKIRDSDKAKLLRAEFREHLNGIQRGLKKQRVKRLKLQHDELTGAPLSKGANFAHIRAVCVDFEMADKDWNGVVVNPETHLVLTKQEILDENDLLLVCESRRWHTEWHGEFRRELRVFEAVGAAA